MSNAKGMKENTAEANAGKKGWPLHREELPSDRG